MTTAGVILAGGRASRVDGADKALFELDGIPLLTRAVDALAPCDEVLIVGPSTGRPAYAVVEWLREEPPFAGPVAALARALEHTRADEIVVLPADLPGAAEAVALLREGDLDDHDGIVVEDRSGMPQWLTARYRSAALADAIRTTGASSVRGAVRSLDLQMRPAPASATADIDTWQDLERAKGLS